MVRSRSRLRGYGWLTICPQELGDELGGESYFTASNAFIRVIHLRAGGYWLQATADYSRYDMAAAERVFRTLAPILIPGQPSNDPPFGPSPHLVLEHPRPAELVVPAKPDRGYTKGSPPRDPATLPIFTLVSAGESLNVLGTSEWTWELRRNNAVFHTWAHNKPGGDRYIKILAELVISQDVGMSVAEWVPQSPDDEGNMRYRASLGNPTSTDSSGPTG
jgi:hypothetical protein